MSEYARNWFFATAPDGKPKVRKTDDDTVVGRRTFTVAVGSAKLRSQFRREIDRLNVYATPIRAANDVETGICWIGDDGRWGLFDDRGEPLYSMPFPQWQTYSVQGTIESLDRFAKVKCVIDVDCRELTVPRTGAGAGEEKPRPKNTSYTPCLPITAMAK